MKILKNKEDAENLINQIGGGELWNWMDMEMSVNDMMLNLKETQHVFECLTGLIKKVYCGVPCGEFIQAVIDNNDLMEAFGKADNVNKKAMYIYVCFIYNYVDIQTLKKAKSNYFVMVKDNEL